MDNHKIFGDINEFAIEIKPYKTPQKFYLRIWLKATSFGDFKRGGGLRYITNSYFRLIKEIGEMYDSKFDGMGDIDIVNDLLFDMTISRSQDEEELLAQRMNFFSWEVADFQITSIGFFIIYPPGQQKMKILSVDNSKSKSSISGYDINKDYFFKIYKEFIDYLDSNDFYPHRL
jgi:hypothetical protein